MGATAGGPTCSNLIVSFWLLVSDLGYLRYGPLGRGKTAAGQDLDLVVASSPKLRISARFQNLAKRKSDYKSIDFVFFCFFEKPSFGYLFQ